jgi:hypothetical protein
MANLMDMLEGDGFGRKGCCPPERIRSRDKGLIVARQAQARAVRPVSSPRIDAAKAVLCPDSLADLAENEQQTHDPVDGSPPSGKSEIAAA